MNERVLFPASKRTTYLEFLAPFLLKPLHIELDSQHNTPKGAQYLLRFLVEKFEKCPDVVHIRPLDSKTAQ